MSDRANFSAATSGFISIPPAPPLKAKLSISVAESLPRYLRFRPRIFFLPIITTLKSYFFPRTEFFIREKGKRGSLSFRVILIMETEPSFILLSDTPVYFAHLNKIFYFFVPFYPAQRFFLGFIM